MNLFYNIWDLSVLRHHVVIFLADEIVIVGLLSDFKSILVLFHANRIKHTSNGILFEQFQKLAPVGSQTFIDKSSNCYERNWKYNNFLYKNKKKLILAAKRPPSSLVRPAIIGTWLNCLLDIRFFGLSGRNGESRSESMRGPKATGYKPNAFISNCNKFNLKMQLFWNVKKKLIN